MRDSKNRKRAHMESEFLSDDPPQKTLRQLEQEKVLVHDPISSFSQHNATQDSFDLPLIEPNLSFELKQDDDGEEEDLVAPFLFDLNFEKPRARSNSIPSVDGPTQQATVISDFSSINDSQVKAKDEVESIVSDFSTEYVAAQTTYLPTFQPKFDLSAHKIPVPSDIRLAGKLKKRFIDLKKNGLADHALGMINQEKESFHHWETIVNGQMAKYGNIVEVCCREDPEIILFRMIETWTEGGLVFSWCVLLKENEIDYLRPKNYQLDNQDTITSFPSQTIPQLPDYIPDEQEEKFLFGFSFAYMHTNLSREKFVEQEQVVGIWPCWIEIHLDLKEHGPCTVNLATKFKANTIY